MKTTERKLFRCAIYTRKSTEHNLDLEFNSLDAQREAARPTSRARPTRAGALSPIATMMAASRAPRSTVPPSRPCWPT